MVKEIISVDALQDFAREFLSQLNGHDNRATVVGLSGELGSGKTAFVQQVAKTLGITEQVISPTFIIMKVYPLPTTHYPLERLVHIDAYRLESGKELTTLGFEELANDPHNLIMIEWPERVREVLPDDMVALSFEHVDETTREIKM